MDTVTLMDMGMIIKRMKEVIDIHCHLLNGVDDGSKSLIVSERLIRLYSEQGVKKIFVTPHVNSSVSKSNRETHIKKFNILQEISLKYDVELHLGAEVYIPFRFPELKFENFTMGQSNVLLLEFSTFHETPIFDHVYKLIQKGYKIIIAHVERYNYLDIEELLEIKELGVYFQVNTSSILSKKNIKHFKKAKILLKNNMIDFIATDCHNETNRPPNLLLALKKLNKLIGEEKALKLVFHNQLKLLFEK